MNNTEKIIKKINSYKSYSQQVKDRVLAQINPNTELSEEKYNQTVRRVPGVMKANAAFIKKYNRVHSLVIKLERHTYSPEQNALHLKGGKVINTPGATTIEAAIEQVVNYNYDLVVSR